ncbi:MAG: AAA family ATPase [Candidatus Cryptobacteroides sp.]|jgi:cytidylate kinase
MNKIINIGRQFGSGGRLVAVEVGRKLGIHVYDNELITKAAEESGFSKEFFARSDEKRRIFNLSSLFGSGRFGTVRNYVGDNELFKIQSDVIRDIASKESAVFVGRCSNYVLRDLACLDVFIAAPLDDRVARVAGREGISLEAARRVVKKQDRIRQTYYDFFTFGHWGAASDYDLCLNSSLLGIAGTADYIIAFGKQAGLI